MAENVKGENVWFILLEMRLLLINITFIFKDISQNFLFHKVQTSYSWFDELSERLKW